VENKLKLIVITFTIILIHIVIASPVLAREGVATGSVVNVRGGPGIENLKVGVVTKGYRMQILAEKDNWYQVSFAENKKGWIVKEFVDVAAEKPSQDNKEVKDVSKTLGVAVVTGKYVNVRSGPGTDHAVIKQAEKGTRLTALEELDGWYQVRLPDGREGYLVDWLAELHRENPTASDEGRSDLELSAVKITGNTVNVRQQPTTASAIIVKTERGEEYPALAKQGDWIKIKINGQEGYIASWLADMLYDSAEADDADSTGSKIDDGESGEGTGNAEVANKENTEPQSSAIHKQVEFAVITGKVVNVRKGPGIANGRVTQVSKGQEFKLLQRKNDWLEVQLSDMSSGWLAGWLADIKYKSNTIEDSEGTEVESNSEVKQEKQTEDEDSNVENDNSKDNKVEDGKDQDNDTGFVVSSGDSTYLYSGPGRDFPKVKSLAVGDRVKIMATASDWHEVKLVDGSSGWMQRRLLVDRGNGDRDKPVQENNGDNSTQGDNVAPKEPKRMYSVAVISSNSAEMRVAVKSTSPIEYSVLSLSSPKRLVVDLPGQILTDNAAKELGLDSSLVKDIRLGQFEAETVRLVLDLEGNIKYEMELNGDKQELVIVISPPDLEGKVIVIDPGHGSTTSWGASDPGAIGFIGTHEEEVVLAIAMKLTAMLEQAGAKVITTRQGKGANINLPDRAAIANDIGADAFVSVHANSSLNRWLKGSATYFYAPYGSNLGSQRGDRRSLAGLIQDEMITAAGTDDLGVREENFSVLRNTTVPSVLVETAFISNAEEEIKLKDPGFQDKLARGIARGIERYFLDDN